MQFRLSSAILDLNSKVAKLLLFTSMIFSTVAYSDSLCSPGFFGPDGSADCVPAPPGYYVANSGATEATIAPAGTFVADEGATAPTIAPAGSYVANPGSIAATLAAPGSYVTDEGQTSATLAAPGYFVADSGATVPTIAPAGSYVQNAGSITATLAAPGSYVADEGQTSATLAAPGYFVADSGATAPTIAPAGSFVQNAGSITATLAAPGSYVADEGQTSATLAAPGYFVADSGATAPTIAPVGYFVADQGSNQAFAAAPGFYAPEEGSVITLICPDDSTSYGAAPACRSGLISMNDPNTIGPEFDSNFGTGSIIDLGALGTNTKGTFLFEIANLTNSLGYADDLTNLTLLDAQFSGLHSDLFSLDGFVLGDVLSEQQSIGFNVDFMSLIETAFSVNLTFFTDQYATFGGSGQVFVFDIRGRFTDNLTEVPAPAHLTLLLFGLGLLLLKFFAKSKKAC